MNSAAVQPHMIRLSDALSAAQHLSITNEFVIEPQLTTGLSGRAPAKMLVPAISVQNGSTVVTECHHVDRLTVISRLSDDESSAHLISVCPSCCDEEVTKENVVAALSACSPPDVIHMYFHSSPRFLTFEEWIYSPTSLDVMRGIAWKQDVEEDTFDWLSAESIWSRATEIIPFTDEAIVNLRNLACLCKDKGLYGMRGFPIGEEGDILILKILNESSPFADASIPMRHRAGYDMSFEYDGRTFHVLAHTSTQLANRYIVASHSLFSHDEIRDIEEARIRSGGSAAFCIPIMHDPYFGVPHYHLVFDEDVNSDGDVAGEEDWDRRLVPAEVGAINHVAAEAGVVFRKWDHRTPGEVISVQRLISMPANPSPLWPSTDLITACAFVGVYGLFTPKYTGSRWSPKDLCRRGCYSSQFQKTYASCLDWYERIMRDGVTRDGKKFRSDSFGTKAVILGYTYAFLKRYRKLPLLIPASSPLTKALASSPNVLIPKPGSDLRAIPPAEESENIAWDMYDSRQFRGTATEQIQNHHEGNLKRWGLFDSSLSFQLTRKTIGERPHVSPPQAAPCPPISLPATKVSPPSLFCEYVEDLPTTVESFSEPVYRLDDLKSRFPEVHAVIPKFRRPCYLYVSRGCVAAGDLSRILSYNPMGRTRSQVCKRLFAKVNPITESYCWNSFSVACKHNYLIAVEELTRIGRKDLIPPDSVDRSYTNRIPDVSRFFRLSSQSKEAPPTTIEKQECPDPIPKADDSKNPEEEDTSRSSSLAHGSTTTILEDGKELTVLVINRKNQDDESVLPIYTSKQPNITKKNHTRDVPKDKTRKFKHRHYNKSIKDGSVVEAAIINTIWGE